MPQSLLLLRTSGSPINSFNLEFTVIALSRSAGAVVTTGAPRLIGLTGATGAAGANGKNGADGLTTSVNGVKQVGGAITLTKANIGLSNVDNTDQIAMTAFVTQALVGTQHTIGEAFGGGIVFYVTPNGTHGLVAVTQDQAEAGLMLKIK